MRIEEKKKEKKNPFDGKGEHSLLYFAPQICCLKPPLILKVNIVAIVSTLIVRIEEMKQNH